MNLPTHLDLAGIEWLETLLHASPFACVVVSHDRYFLENVATEMAELNRIYPNGIPARAWRLQQVPGEEGRISARAVQADRKRSENLVHSEIEVAASGAKARTRKSKARIDKANELIETGGLERKNPNRHSPNRFLRPAIADETVD